MGEEQAERSCFSELVHHIEMQYLKLIVQNVFATLKDITYP
jgi:hypothetical protein